MEGEPGGRTIQQRHEGVWFGPVVPEDLLFSSPATSAAANRWQTGILEALTAWKPIRVLGCTPQPAWPRGQLLAPSHRAFLAATGVEASMCGYLNLPAVKLAVQGGQLVYAAEREVRRNGCPAITFTYNAGLPEALAARWLRRSRSVPWVCVVADFPGSSLAHTSIVHRIAGRGYSRLQRVMAESADGRVHLSWASFRADRGPRKFYLEGGVSRLQPRGRAVHAGDRVVLMYAGSLGVWTGIDLLLAAFARVTNPSCELWISGRGASADEVVQATRRDRRIRYYGLVTQERLDGLMAEADIFINPRPSSYPENRFNFPSKLLEYLSWARPVISTMTPGIPPDYEEILCVLRDETPKGLANSICELVRRLPAEQQVIENKLRKFVEEKLLWSVQADRLRKWLDAEVLRA